MKLIERVVNAKVVFINNGAKTTISGSGITNQAIMNDIYRKATMQYGAKPSQVSIQELVEEPRF